MRHRVLIIEDDLTIAGNLYAYLEAQGFIPDVAYDGACALALFQQYTFDAVVLDLGLPGLDGLRVVRALRVDNGSNVPVLILTARDALEDKLAGFAHEQRQYLGRL
ncbi:MAG: response regulator transcription factor, partial [Comamonadaceae bacterium]